MRVRYHECRQASSANRAIIQSSPGGSWRVAEYLTFVPHSPMAQHTLNLRTDHVVAPARWTYEIRDPLGNPIWSVEEAPDGLLMSIHTAQGALPSTTLAKDAMFAEEWPCRLAHLRFQVGYQAEASLAWPFRWNWETDRSEPMQEPVQVVVLGGVPVVTPAGRFATWQVRLGERQMAWYDEQPPHALVRYTDGIVTYVLVDHEPAWSGPSA